MAVPFLTFKDELLAKVAQAGVCDAYHELSTAIDYQTMLAAGCGYYRWGFTVIIDDTLLAEFPDVDLNDFGVYKTDVTLTNPASADYLGCSGPGYAILTEDAPADDECGQELFFLGGNFTLTLDGNNTLTIYAMRNSNGTIILNDTSQLTLFAVQDSVLDITINNNSSLCLEANDNSSLSIVANNNSVVNASLRGNSITSYTGNDLSSAVYRTYMKSTLNYAIGGTSFIYINKFHALAINNFLP